AVLARIRLAKLDPSDLGGCIRFIRRLQRTAEERGFRNRLWCELRVNARASKKEQLAHTSLVREADCIVLDSQIIEQEFDGVFVVGFYPAPLCRRDDDDVRPFACKKFRNRRFVGEIKL